MVKILAKEKTDKYFRVKPTSFRLKGEKKGADGQGFLNIARAEDLFLH